MNQPFHWTGEQYDELLNGGDSSVDNAALRRTILAQTLPVVRRRRWVRRAALAAMLAACYAAGLASPLLWRDRVPASVASRNNVPDAQESDTFVAARQVAKSAHAPAAVPSPPAHPQRVAQDRRTKYETFRDSGDRWLRDAPDISLAIQGYAAALRSASADERAMAPQRDTWLLLALKRAKLQENSHDERKIP